MRTTLDPVDCLLAATSLQEKQTLLTFDKALLKVAVKGTLP